jgi:dTDP-4-amino-4,6-dideoxygalactose transaminase
VFVDIEPDTLNLDPERIERAITPRTRALLPAHLYGHPADMPAIVEIARKHGLVVIEDAAQAHGAACDGKKVGTWGTGCFSFYPTKNMTTAEGGLITTDDAEIADRARTIRNHGQRARYEHHILGYNYRMTDLHAALGLVQVEHLEAWNRQRIENARYMSQHLEGVVVPIERPGCRHVFHQWLQVGTGWRPGCGRGGSVPGSIIPGRSISSRSTSIWVTISTWRKQRLPAGRFSRCRSTQAWARRNGPPLWQR